MQKHRLLPHPGSPYSPVSSIIVLVDRLSEGHISLNFRATGAVDQVAWPGDTESGNGPWARADGLWEHSCFEAFATVPGESGYFEANLSTSGRWAAYAFYDYREGMRDATDVSIVAGNWRIRSRRAELDVLLEVPAPYRHATWLLGLSAVIEAKDGGKSYWALRHAHGPPDFHNRDCFTALIPAAP